MKVAVQQGGSNRTFTLYSGTKVVSEFSDTSSTTYTAGTTPQQAPADSLSLLLYQHVDHLTTRMTTDNFGNTASLEGHLPYGEQWYENGGAMGSVMRKFTSYYKDSESASGLLNYAVAREHSARLGRFHMPDPVFDSENGPQGLNRYAYVAGDPINRIDPSGQCSFGFCGDIRPFARFTPIDGAGKTLLCAIPVFVVPAPEGPDPDCALKLIPHEFAVYPCKPDETVLLQLSITGLLVQKGPFRPTGNISSVTAKSSSSWIEATKEGKGYEPIAGEQSVWAVEFKTTKKARPGDTATIDWFVDYTCKGSNYSTSITDKMGVTCARHK